MVRSTTIVIAPRLSTVRNVDTIIILQHGQIVESGNHDVLMAEEPGAYAALMHMQAARSLPSIDNASSVDSRYVLIMYACTTLFNTFLIETTSSTFEFPFLKIAHCNTENDFVCSH